MTLSLAPDAYLDCHRAMSAALDDSRGRRYRFPTKAKADYFNMRCNQLRLIDRRESKRIHEPDTPGWGCSEFDKLTIRKPREDDEGGWWIYIEHVGLDVGEGESLSELES